MITTAPILNNLFFSLRQKNRVIFFLCGVCDILVLIFLFWIANLTRLLFFVIFLYTINTNILGLLLSQDWDVYSGRSIMKIMKLKLQGPLFRRSPWNKKSLKIPKGQSETVYRRTDNTMAKRTGTNNDRQNIHIKLKIE